MNSNEKEIKFETLEDVVKYVEANHHRATTKWQLSSRTTHPWVDPKAGAKWHDEYYGMKYVSIGEPGRKDYELSQERLAKLEPAKLTVVEYYLVDSSTWHSNYLFLSKELYDLFDSVWTKSPAWRGSDRMENKARLTLPGILKRLGNTSVAEKIKEVKQAERLLSEKRSRNHDRKQIREQAQKLYSLLISTNVVEYMESKDIYFFARLTKLTKLIDEE